MSSNVRNVRKDRSRFPASSARQEWVPRGSMPTITTPNTTTTATTHVNQPLNVNLNENPKGRELNSSAPHPVNRDRVNHGPRVHMAPRRNQRKDKEKDKEKSGDRGEKELRLSNLPQLVHEIQEKLMKGTVECMICYDMVVRSAPIWSCSSCFCIFHLFCIRKWARAPTSTDLMAEKNQGLNWRCPGCQSVQLTSSREIRYVCFCGKRQEPPSDLYLTPHSCGEPCGKPLDREILVAGGSKEDLCPHNCVLQCHPGPCPPCKAFAPPRLCPCGKKLITTRCSDRKSALTCGQCCDRLLDCGRHRCKKICHLGPCDPCQVLVSASCFCKKTKELVLCGGMDLKGEVNTEDGVFSCSSICGKSLNCSSHFCSDICHPGPCGGCGLMPDMIKTCYCGKTPLREERTSCLDPIPTCSELCEKLLPCVKHRCKEVCHAGDCAPCLVQVVQKCRCGSTSRNVECYKTSSPTDIFTCEKPCGWKKNCGRHRCSERCCPLSNSSYKHSGDWDPHFCVMRCGKKLRCGQHSCESLCHSGHCSPCPETIFTDLTCACGKTSIPPPLPCGTPPPSCQLPCSVPQPCGHFSTHSCHFGDCPPCTVPIAKECIGGHVVLRNIPCGSRDIRCNKLCGKTRQCGMHACSRTCHPPPCDTSAGSDSGQKTSCGQTCGAPRRDCRHTCTAPCHPASSCPDARCEFPVIITCSCGQITASVPCDAGGSSIGFNTDTLYASIIQKLPSQLQPVEATGRKVPLGQRKLTCDDECSKLERKRVLADAFDINPPNLDALHFGDSAASELLADLFRRDPKWVLSVEERCKILVLGKNRGAMSGLKIHVFCPMPKDKRDAVRLIAERWKLVINSVGWEPKRFITIHVTPKSKVPPRVIGIKGSTTTNTPHLPAYDPLVDMDPRLVVSFPDLPRESDISALVLRFGGECELVWLNDKNALAVFSDPARAATAMRRLDHGTAYHGASLLQNGGASASSNTNAWGGENSREGGASKSSNPWKRAVVQDSSWKDTSWGDEEWSGPSIDVQASVWKSEAPLPASLNRWHALDTESGVSSSTQSTDLNPGNRVGHSSSGSESGSSTRLNSGEMKNVTDNGTNMSEVADDWEEAYD